MMGNIDAKDIATLKTRVPLNNLSDAQIESLCDSIDLSDLKRGSLVFSTGDEDSQHIYLLDGRVQLIAGGRIVDQIDAGTDTAKFPIAHHQPRVHDVRVLSRARLARIDSAALNALLTGDNEADYEVDELDADADADWMGVLLRSRLLRQIPPNNVQEVIQRVEAIDAVEGETIIKQGDPGDSYYVLTAGEAIVTRRANRQAAEEEVAHLVPGSTFGEEALLSDIPRNSTVTMSTDGSLLRLHKVDFLELIQQPLSRTHTFGEARALVEQGAIWLDVRSKAEFAASNLPNSINVPFESLRHAIRMQQLDRDKSYIALSSTAGEAVATAFLLTEQGLDVSVLAGDFKGLGVSSDDEVGADSQSVNERVQDSVARTRQLEGRMRSLEEDRQDQETTRRENEAALQAVVEKARGKISAHKSARLRAENDLREAGREMERLSTDLQQIERERNQLREQVDAMGGQDSASQARLVKLERELLREREIAESAQDTLEEINDKLAATLADRERERRIHERQVGTLKEQITELQLALEEARSGLESSQLLRDVGGDGDAAEAEIRELRERVALLERDLVRAQAHGARSDDRKVADLREALDRASEERDDARRQAADLESEVDELRSMMDVYSEQVSAARSASGDSKLMREELESARSDAAREIEALRDELELAQARLALDQTSQDQDAVKLEALRQEVSELKDSLRERQRELKESAIARQQVEDELEDAHANVDRLQILLDSALSEAETLKARLPDTDTGGASIEVSEIVPEGSDAAMKSLSDERVESASDVDVDRALDRRGGGRSLLWLIVGLALGAAGLEAYAVMNGGGMLLKMWGGG